MKNILSFLKRKNQQLCEIHNSVSNLKFYMRRIQLEDKILHGTESGISTARYCDHDIIVSLTTYGRRLEDVCFTIESLMQQTKKANRIVLWLAPEDFARPLSEALIRQQARGLEIRETEDLRSYTKLVPALRAYPDAAIITVDDDVLYDFDVIERLIGAYLADPQSIHACRVHTMLPDGKGGLKSYNDWMRGGVPDPNAPSRNFFTGVGGVLYPPHSLDEETTNRAVFASICPTADDVWFNAMARKKGTPVRKVATRSINGEDYLSNDDVQEMGLCNVNTGRRCMNDPQIQAVFEKYAIHRFIK